MNSSYKGLWTMCVAYRSIPLNTTSFLLHNIYYTKGHTTITLFLSLIYIKLYNSYLYTYLTYVSLTYQYTIYVSIKRSVISTYFIYILVCILMTKVHIYIKMCHVLEHCFTECWQLYRLPLYVYPRIFMDHLKTRR